MKIEITLSDEQLQEAALSVLRREIIERNTYDNRIVKDAVKANMDRIMRKYIDAHEEQIISRVVENTSERLAKKLFLKELKGNDR